jgi:hypothetical protein
MTINLYVNQYLTAIVDAPRDDVAINYLPQALLCFAVVRAGGPFATKRTARLHHQPLGNLSISK